MRTLSVSVATLEHVILLQYMELENNQNQEQQQNEAKREVRWNGIFISVLYSILALLAPVLLWFFYFFNFFGQKTVWLTNSHWLSLFFLFLFILGIFSSVGNETPFKKWSIRFLSFTILLVMILFILPMIFVVVF